MPILKVPLLVRFRRLEPNLILESVLIPMVLQVGFQKPALNPTLGSALNPVMRPEQRDAVSPVSIPRPLEPVPRRKVMVCQKRLTLRPIWSLLPVLLFRRQTETAQIQKAMVCQKRLPRPLAPEWYPVVWLLVLRRLVPGPEQRVTVCR